MSKNKTKKISLTAKVLFVALLMVSVAGISTIVKADVSISQVIGETAGKILGEKLASDLGFGGELLGGGVHNSFETFDAGVGVKGVEVLDSDGFLVKDGGTVTEGYFTVVLNATSSAVTVNPIDDTIWVYDSYVIVDTATTSEIGYFVGTTTATFIARDGSCAATGVCDQADAKEASIINPGTTQNVGYKATTAGDIYFQADFPGTDTRDGSGTRQYVPVESGEYVSLFASTTPSDNLEVGGQAATAVIRYKYIE